MSDGPIRLFVGCSANGEDAEAQMCLEYTAKTLSSLPVEITWMQQARKGFWSGWNTASWATPFTGFRWGIPAACKYEGRAIYSDVDVFFRADLAELWRQPIPDPAVLLLRRTDGKLRTCVMLFDNAKMKPHLPEIEKLKALPDPNGAMRVYFAQHRDLLAPFTGDWNAIDVKNYDDVFDDRIKAIHYSSMAHQPHLRYAVPRLKAAGQRHWYDGEMLPHWREDLVTLFDKTYTDAYAAGYTVEQYLPKTPFGPYKKKSWKDYKAPATR